MNGAFVGSIHLPLNKWWAFMNTVMNIRLLQKGGKLYDQLNWWQHLKTCSVSLSCQQRTLVLETPGWYRSVKWDTLWSTEAWKWRHVVTGLSLSLSLISKCIEVVRPLLLNAPPIHSSDISIHRFLLAGSAGRRLCGFIRSAYAASLAEGAWIRKVS
jgi:hypothetical protein